jgi:hypothetical protein
MKLFDLNYDVLLLIIAHLDKSSLRQFMVTNHAACDLGLPFLASSVILRTPLQLSSFCHFALSRSGKRVPQYLRSLYLSGTALKFPMDVSLLSDLLTQAVGLEEVVLWDSERMMFNDPRIRQAIASRRSLVRLVLGEGAGRLTDALLRSLAAPLTSLSMGRRRNPPPSFETLLPWRRTLQRLKLCDFSAATLPSQARWDHLTHLSLFAPRVHRGLLFMAFPRLRQLQLEDNEVLDSLHARNLSGAHLAWPRLEAVTMDLIAMYHYPIYSNVKRLDVSSFGATSVFHAKQPKLAESFFASLAASSPTIVSTPLLSDAPDFWMRVVSSAPRLETLHLILLNDASAETIREILASHALARRSVYS